MRLLLKNSKLVFGKVEYVNLSAFQVGSLDGIYGGNILVSTSYPQCATSKELMMFDTDVVLSTTNYEFCVWYKVDPNGEDDNSNFSREGYDYSTSDKTISAGTKFCITVRTGVSDSVHADLEEANSCITGSKMY